MASDMTLTVDQAADLLSASVAWVVSLLDAEEIGSRVVGGARRVDTASLLAYRYDHDDRDRVAVAKLAALGRELDLAS